MTILVVDDEPSVCQLFVDALGEGGHKVLAAPDGEAAVALAGQEPFDLAFLDIRMPGPNGVETLGRLKAARPQATYIMISGFADGGLLDQAMSAGADMCLAKPIGVRELRDLVQMMSGDDSEEPLDVLPAEQP